MAAGALRYAAGNFRISHERLHQRLEVRILKGGDESGQRLPELVDVLCGLWKVVRKFDFRFAQLAQLVDRELKPVLVFVDQAFDFEKIVLLEGVEDFFDVVPHLGFELTAAVAEREGEVRLAGFLRLDLLGDHDKIGGDDFVFVADAIADVELFHDLSLVLPRVPKRTVTATSSPPHASVR